MRMRVYQALLFVIAVGSLLFMCGGVPNVLAPIGPICFTLSIGCLAIIEAIATHGEAMLTAYEHLQKTGKGTAPWGDRVRNGI